VPIDFAKIYQVPPKACRCSHPQALLQNGLMDWAFAGKMPPPPACRPCAAG